MIIYEFHWIYFGKFSNIFSKTWNVKGVHTCICGCVEMAISSTQGLLLKWNICHFPGQRFIFIDLYWRLCPGQQIRSKIDSFQNANYSYFPTRRDDFNEGHIDENNCVHYFLTVALISILFSKAFKPSLRTVDLKRQWMSRFFFSHKHLTS